MNIHKHANIFIYTFMFIYASVFIYYIHEYILQRSNFKYLLNHLASLGEGLWFSPVSTETYNEKKRMLDAYRIMNRKVASDFNVTYIDLREAFIKESPPFRRGYQGCLTVDGKSAICHDYSLFYKDVFI